MIDEQPSAVIEAMIKAPSTCSYLATHRNIDTVCRPPLSNISDSVCARLGAGAPIGASHNRNAENVPND
jgi:hypothetical protein